MIRVTLAQIDTTPGAINGNLQKALDAWESAKKAGANVLLLPEMTITGYPAKDLLTRSGFIARNEKAVEEYAKRTADGPASLIGFALAHEGIGTRVYNAAAFCRNGVIEKIYRKWLLPTYDVFDEDRYFDEGNEIAIVEINGAKVGITVCEDIWNDELYWARRRYTVDPVASSVKAGAQFILNLSASPFSIGKPEVRRHMLQEVARRHKVPIAMCNLVGGNDDLVFDGSSVCVDASGRLIKQMASFGEDLYTFDMGSDLPTAPEPIRSDTDDVIDALALGVRDYVRKTGFSKVLIGLSGGIDSALVAALAVQALGSENVTGILMPSRYSSEHSKDDARNLAENLGIAHQTIPIEKGFAALLDQIGLQPGDPATKLAQENLQSRIRGLTLMTLSNASGAMVLTTGNKSEVAVGYCTLYGDMCGGLAVIADVPKTFVYTISRRINERAGREIIPESTLTKAPSAELSPGQFDSDSLPPYDVLDSILAAYIEEGLDADEIIERGADPAVVRRVIRLVEINEYKRRQSAPTLKVTSRAFGYGWRMPIARGN